MTDIVKELRTWAKADFLRTVHRGERTAAMAITEAAGEIERLRDRLEDTTAALVNLRQAALRILRDKPVDCFDVIDERAENAIEKNRAALESGR